MVIEIAETIDRSKIGEASLTQNLENRIVSPENQIEIGPLIGKGGLGEVYEAHMLNNSASRKIAIKVSYRCEESLESLRKEAYIATQLGGNPYIIKVDPYFDAEIDKTSVGMIPMEYLRGIDIRKIIEKHNSMGLHFPQGFAGYIGWACCEGLDYAHNPENYNTELFSENGDKIRGVLHRDISPGNIIIDIFGAPKLIDFGLVGIMSQNGKEKISRFRGSLGFIAPESISENEVDPRSDIYSLGMILDYLTRGAIPTLSCTQLETTALSQILNSFNAQKEGYPQLNTLPGIDDNFSKIIEKATNFKESQRHDSALDLSNELKAHIYSKGRGPDKDGLRTYLNLIFEPGMNRYLKLLRNGGRIDQIPNALKNKIEKAKTKIPYMVKKGKFTLETLDEPGYIKID